MCCFVPQNCDDPAAVVVQVMAMEAESEAVGMLVAGDGLEGKFAQVRTSHCHHQHGCRAKRSAWVSGQRVVPSSCMDLFAI